MSFLDFPARPYDASLCQFWTDDPLREKYYAFEPRLYCGGDPVNSIDPTGMIVIARDKETQDMIRNTLPLFRSRLDQSHTISRGI